MAKLVQPDIALDAVWWRDRVSRRRGVGPYEPDAPTTYYSSGTEVHYIISFAFIDVMGASYGQCSGASNCGFGSEWGERAYLKRQVRGRRVARSLSERCRAILRCADGIPSKSVANELGIHEHTVGKWRRRFLKDRIEGLLDEARPGRPRTIDDDQIAAVIERTLRSTPEDSTHW